MTDSSSIFSSWSDPLLGLYLSTRSVSSPQSPSHDELVSLAVSATSRPITPIHNTPSTVFDLMTLAHLNEYLRNKRDQAVNGNARWGIGSPPKLGRIKVDALREFAKKDFETIEQSEFDQYVAEVLSMKVKLRDDEARKDLGALCVRDDDVDVLFSDWGIQREDGWNHEEALDVLQRSLDLFANQ